MLIRPITRRASSAAAPSSAAGTVVSTERNVYRVEPASVLKVRKKGRKESQSKVAMVKARAEETTKTVS